MKKTIRKLTAAALVLILFLSMSVSAFAQEIEPCAIITCSHPYMAERTESGYSFYNEELHHYYEATYYSCMSCTFSYTVKHADYYEEHDFPPYTDEDNNGIYTAICTCCGYERYMP